MFSTKNCLFGASSWLGSWSAAASAVKKYKESCALGPNRGQKIEDQNGEFEQWMV
jgi:hypothetical protein